MLSAQPYQVPDRVVKRREAFRKGCFTEMPVKQLLYFLKGMHNGSVGCAGEIGV
jgi:hypothetical protein